MSTNGSIAIRNTNGTITAIYSHWDNYPDHAGRILKEHYNTDEKIRTLLSHGNLSVLNVEIGVKHPFHNPCSWGTKEYQAWDEEHGKMCTFYGRDRGESDQEAPTFQNITEWIYEYGQEYNYLWNGQEWLVNSHSRRDGMNYAFTRVEETVDMPA